MWTAASGGTCCLFSKNWAAKSLLLTSGCLASGPFPWIFTNTDMSPRSLDGAVPQPRPAAAPILRLYGLARRSLRHAQPQRSPPGGAVASAWSILHFLGEEGFLRLAKAARRATEKLVEGIQAIPGLFVLGKPPATVFSFGSDKINIYQLAVKLKREAGTSIPSTVRPACI